ncbi:TPA: hypothetical protein KDY89_004187 [Vibrio parahaemolyticus]|nr:hypothetical protein [Vibrio parahaemolyticus]
MTGAWTSIQLGDEVTWAIKSDYYEDFQVLDLFFHPDWQDEWGEPVRMALLKPLNPERFCALMLETALDSPADLRVEVPVAMLLPVAHVVH